jgi:hypothetical protein
VSWHCNSGKRVAKIRCDGEIYYLGSFDDLIEAAVVYDIAARKYHGEFAVTFFN